MTESGTGPTVGPVPDLDPRWPKLLAAARSWKAGVIRGTSTSTSGATHVLIEAIDAFDQCEHPRLAWVFYQDGRTECSSCHTTIARAGEALA